MTRSRPHTGRKNVCGDPTCLQCALGRQHATRKRLVDDVDDLVPDPVDDMMEDALDLYEREYVHGQYVTMHELDTIVYRLERQIEQLQVLRDREQTPTMVALLDDIIAEKKATLASPVDEANRRFGARVRDALSSLRHGHDALAIAREQPPETYTRAVMEAIAIAWLEEAALWSKT